MSNLLPVEMRSSAWSAVRTRLLLLCGATLIATALLALLALAPSALVLSGIDRGGEERAGTRAEDAQALVDAQSVVIQIKAWLSTTTPARTAREIVMRRPAGMAIEHISYSGGTTGTLSFSGSAKARDDINAFRAQLAADPRFAQVSVPIDALVGAQGEGFTMTVSGAF